MKPEVILGPNIGIPDSQVYVNETYGGIKWGTSWGFSFEDICHTLTPLVEWYQVITIID